MGPYSVYPFVDSPEPTVCHRHKPNSHLNTNLILYLKDQIVYKWQQFKWPQSSLPPWSYGFASYRLWEQNFIGLGPESVAATSDNISFTYLLNRCDMFLFTSGVVCCPVFIRQICVVIFVWNA